MNIWRSRLSAIILVFITTADFLYADVSIELKHSVNKLAELHHKEPLGIRVPIARSCRIDLKNKTKVTVRVLGSQRIFHYPLIRPSGSDAQIMALEQGVASELLDAPFFRAYAVPKYGIGYGYDGTGLLVYSGLLIEDCPLPTPVTGLFMPVKLVSPYVNREFLTRYFTVLDE